MSGPSPNPIDAMTLRPRHLPGRSTRKARALQAEIVRLRAEGYTFEAIREALGAAGVQVGLTTVKREAARQAAKRATVPQAPRIVALPSRRAYPDGSPPAPRQGESSTPPAVSSPSPDGRSGKDIAEDFVRNRITNPLLRHRS